MGGQPVVDGEAEVQMRTATDVIWEAVHRLLRESEVHPQLVTLAVFRVAAELAASPVLAAGLGQERLVEVMSHVGQGSPGS
jgi:hypothetical protein